MAENPRFVIVDNPAPAMSGFRYTAVEQWQAAVEQLLTDYRDVAEAARQLAATNLTDGHGGCLDCGFGEHRDDCDVVDLRAALARLQGDMP